MVAYDNIEVALVDYRLTHPEPFVEHGPQFAWELRRNMQRRLDEGHRIVIVAGGWDIEEHAMRSSK